MNLKTNPASMPSSFGYRLFVAIVILAVVAGIIGGLVISGSPSKERLRTLDRRRSDQISQLSNAIDSFYNNKGYLPGTVDTLQSDQATYGYLNEALLDPVTRLPYEYHITSSSTFELCGTFDTDTSEPQSRVDLEPSNPQMYSAWHPAGRACFPHTVTNWNKR